MGMTRRTLWNHGKKGPLSASLTTKIRLRDPVEEWVKELKIESTEKVPIPERLVDQVIGQEAASIVVKKASEQRRHMIMVGEPGTGKSMLARSMTEFLPPEQLEDVLVYRNLEDENEPRSGQYLPEGGPD